MSHQFVSGDGVVMQNVSSTRDEKEHARLRRPVNHAYALTTLLGYEKLMDVTTSAFFRQLEERFVATGAECDLANWLQFYAFDVIGEMTFGTRFGFCEQGQDVGDMLKHTMAHMKWMSSMGQLPWLDNKIRLQNWFARKFRKTNEIVRFAAYHIDLHLKQEKTGTEEWGDFISRCQSAVQKYPSIMTPDQIVDYATTNVSAGSDTTAIILREVIYRLHVDKQGRLERILSDTKEVLKARFERGEDLSAHISWKESSSMPFLDACIKETMRIHPALGHVLPRVVPAGGVTLCGKFLPEGTEVGCNAWTVHRDKSVFGEDVDVWRPERYLEGDPEAIKLMERSNFVFGGGSRTCMLNIPLSTSGLFEHGCFCSFAAPMTDASFTGIGRHIATLELMKLVPEFLRVFEIDLVDPKRYKDNYSWIVMQSGLDVKLKLRDQKSWLGVYS